MNKPFRYSFDSKCFELAEYFLPAQATTAAKNELAQALQDTVENFGLPYAAPPKRDCTCIPPKFCAVCA